MNPNDLLDIFTAEGKDLLWWQLLARTLLVYVGTLAIVRIGKKRLLGQGTAMDIVLGVVLGSSASRAINGSASLLPTLLAALLLVSLHALSSMLSFHSHKLGALIKGEPHHLIRDGALLEERMRGCHITRHDIEEFARLEAHLRGLDGIQEAQLERNGKISIIPKKEGPKVVEVRVENGVQLVRIELA